MFKVNIYIETDGQKEAVPDIFRHSRVHDKA